MSVPRSTPVKVSPFIRGARYSLLLAGIIYGINKKAIYEMYEKREKPRREAIIQEKKENQIKKSEADLQSLVTTLKNLLGADSPPDL